jgi:uncharacterized protein (DUF924 family)
MSPDDVLDFWFRELTSAEWYQKDDALDQLISERFGELHAEARQAELFGWRNNIEGRLAEIIVLDQFSRNIFRDRAEAFSTDALALALAQETIASNKTGKLDSSHRAFLYLPYMHSESRRIHKLAVGLFSEPGMENNLDFENKHKAIIDRFGRYPHRNKILGRVSTQEEVQFLKTEGSSF